MPHDRSRIGRNNRKRAGAYERDIAKRLQAVWPGAYRVERSGAGREKGDIGGTPRLHWSVRSGLSLDWRQSLADAAREVAELQGDAFPISVLVDRSCRPLRRIVQMDLDDFLAYLEWRDNQRDA